MACFSRAFRALMRRNVIYRKRKIVGSILEMVLPVAFICILVAIKISLEDNENFSAKTVLAEIPENSDARIPFSFTDYVTAIQAKRICQDIGLGNLAISGIQYQGYNWQVPFVKCDSRACKEAGEDAGEKYCEYQILAVAPIAPDDEVAKNRTASFRQYVNKQFPQLLDSEVMPFDYDFVQEFESDNAVENYVTASDYGKTGHPKIAVAVVFSSGSSPKAYEYKLRVNSTNFNAPEESERPAVLTTPPTDRLFDNFAKTDEDACVTEDSTPFLGPLQYSCNGQYIYNGALTIQRLVGDWIMAESGARDAGYFVAEHGVQYVPFPTKQHEVDGFYSAIAFAAPLIITLGLLYPVAAIIQSITLEKELRQKELMKMMSVTESDIGWSWFLSYFLFHLVTTIAATAATTALYPSSKVLYLFIFWLLTFIAATIVFAMLMSSFITKSTRATLIGLLIFFVGVFLTLAVDFETGKKSIIGLISLHPVAAFSYGLQEIGRLEDAGIGLTSNTVGNTDSPSGYTFNNAIQCLIIDSILWGVVSFYLNRVVPSECGQPLPWYFPFKRSYWCPASAVSPGATESDVIDETGEESIPMEPVSDALQEQANEGRSIEIHDLRKQFGEKTAVDGLTLSMYSGQVTALLGHNGAGKTTTINMLTGMITPTDGYAVVAGKDIRTQMNQIRQEIGICLQQNCLFPLLTVKEHVQFFSRIKGLYAKTTHADAEVAIKTAIEDVALGEKANALSKNLSGGMKRKLSVAIAFCGDSKTVLLDEPTSGMDPFSRRFTWNVIRQYRQDRCIVLTTHMMDEADVLGDRIAIMAEGQLRCVGSPLFLKKSYGVGYQLTIEKRLPTIDESCYGTSAHPVEEEKSETGVPVERRDQKLEQIVTDAVSEASLLSNVGAEMSFQLPLGASSEFGPMFDGLDREIETGGIVTYGVGITTLDEVFLLVARGETGGEPVKFASSTKVGDGVALRSDDDKSHQSRMDLEEEGAGLFVRHVQALFQKRAVNFKRDKKAWCCSTILPGIFVLLGFLFITYIYVPDRYQDAMTVTLEDYNVGVDEEPRNPIPFNNPGSYRCQPGDCVYDMPVINLTETNETYSYCGYSARLDGADECSIVESADFVSRITEAGAEGIPDNVSDVKESSLSLNDTTTSYQASQYGALYLTHEVGSTTTSGDHYGDTVVATCKQNLGDYMEETQCENYRGIGYVINYNFTALHSSVLFQTVADEAIVKEALDDDEFSITTTVHPLPITSKEDSFGQAEDAGNAWFLLVLGFPFITGTFGTFIVAEKQSGAKHLQTVAGVQPASYWLSSYLWDITNYQFPLWITVILMFAFDVENFTTTDRNVVGGVIVTMVLFGPASAGLTYCMTFLFQSPSVCNLSVIILNFIVGLVGPLVVFILRLIGEDATNPNASLVTASKAIEWILRLIPSFCLGNALLKAINIQTYEYLAEEPITVWHSSVVLYEVIFLAAESVVYIMLAIQIDMWSNNPRAVSIWKNFVRFITCRCFCRKGTGKIGDITAALPVDEDVAAEAERVLAGGANDDLIVTSQLTKQYPNGTVAVNNISFGVPSGQCFGLLGVNGAGKTTVMAMLTAEFPPTSGDATLAGYSVTKEPEMTRRRIGYCPQFDALFVNMTGREHVELYASIKGVPREAVREASIAKLTEVGLSESDYDRLSANYSGGMKRKLSLACATIGQPQIVFLDEPSTGMDPVARHDMWRVISDMVTGDGTEDDKTGIVLTTHSMEEAEALCPRIAIMANGKFTCLGSAQHLKSRFGEGFQVEIKLKEMEDEDEDYKRVVAHLLSESGSTPPETSDEEAAAPNIEDIYFSLNQALAAVNAFTGDEYLASLITSSNPTGYIIWKNASSGVGVALDELAEFTTEELRMRDLQQFIASAYTSSVLRERQDNKARFEVSSEGVKISLLFATIEANKERLMIGDYGISQTTLEQVFNMHAAEAEKLKNGGGTNPIADG